MAKDRNIIQQIKNHENEIRRLWLRPSGGGPGGATYAVKVQAYNQVLTLTSGDEQALEFTQSIFDSTNGNMWDGTTGLIAPVTGLYVITANWEIDSVPYEEDRIESYIREVSGTLDGVAMHLQKTAGTNRLACSITGSAYLTSGQKIEIRIYNGTSSTIATFAGAGGSEEVIAGGPVAAMWLVGNEGSGGFTPKVCARQFSGDTSIFDTSPSINLVGTPLDLDTEVVNTGGYTWNASEKKLHVDADGLYRFGLYGRYRISVNGGGSGYDDNLMIWNVYSSQQTAESYHRVVVLDGNQLTEQDGGFLNIISYPIALAANNSIYTEVSGTFGTTNPADINWLGVYGDGGDEQLTMWIEKLN